MKKEPIFTLKTVFSRHLNVFKFYGNISSQTLSFVMLVVMLLFNFNVLTACSPFESCKAELNHFEL